jgi:hypothetical protein
MEALAERFHYFQPFHPPQPVKNKMAAVPAVAHVLSPAADPHYWQQQVNGKADNQALATDFLQAGGEAVQRAVPLYATSIRRKRKLKMNKHKRRKLRKRTRALRKRLGKI